MSMKFNQSEIWDADGNITLCVDIEDADLGLKAEWLWECHGGGNTFDGTINGRQFNWDDRLRWIDWNNEGELQLLEKVIFLYVKIQLLEWKLEEVTNA